ncbi:hypothetical protein [Streptomyces mirabilis]|uniref:hypothetical protein n=1 Tax=Streptomyces mirabilis TaxID=68239 RepID=UPI0021C22D8E|nr:hypothetical protein [Streptomyces mirabilis]MCT9105246.1 hypothetical protein [Streptomyces mirabilis]
MARIKELCTRLGKPLENVLHVPRLARTTGLTTAEVQTLLSGNVPLEVDPDIIVRQRVRFLYEAHTGDDGQPRDIHEIAASIKQTPTWTKRLVQGEAKPNLVVGHALCKFYGVETSFLTDSSAEALSRELRNIRIDLEVEADPQQALRTLGVVHISARNTEQFKDMQLASVAKMVAKITDDLDGVKDKLERMGYAEDDR